MDRWRNQLNNVSSNAFDFVQRISSEITAETEDPGSELQYHKNVARSKERELTSIQNELEQKTKDVNDLNEQLKEAYAETELTRQGLLNRIAAKELELQRAKHEIEKLRDFQPDSFEVDDQSSNDLKLELELIRAEKASLSEELHFVSQKLTETEKNYRNAVVVNSNTTEFTDEIDRLKKSLAFLETENEKLNHELTERPSSKASEHSRVKVEELEEIERQVEKLKSEKESFKSLYEEESRSNKRSEAALEQLLGYCEVLGKEIESNLVINRDLLFMNTQYKAELQAVESEKHQKEQVEHVVVDDSAQKEQINLLESELNKYFKQSRLLIQERNELLARCDQLQQSFIQLSSENQVLVEQHKSLLEQQSNAPDVTVVNDDIQQKEGRIVELENILKNMQEQHQTLLGQYEALAEQQNTLSDVVSGNENEVKEKQRRILELEESLRIVQEQNQALVQQQQILVEAQKNTIETTTLHEDIKEKELRVFELENALRSIDAEKEKDTQKGEELQSHFSQAYELIQDFCQEFNIHSDNYGQQNNFNLTYEIRNLVLTLKSNIQSYQEQLNHLNEKINAVEYEKHETANRFNQISGQSMHLHEENNILRNKIITLEDTLAAKDSEKSKVSEELTQLKQNFSNLQSEQKGLKEGSAEVEMFKLHTQTKIERKEAELIEKNGILEQTEADLQYQKATVTQLQQENESLKSLVNGLSETVKELQSTYAETAHRLRSLQLETTEKESKFKSQLEDQNSQTTILQSEKGDLEKKLEEFETIINDLRTEINALDRTEPVSTASSIDSKQGARPSITMSSTGFVVPQVVRQFIISAVTCDPNKREESALLLANIIGCTLEEKNQISQSFLQKAGWGSFFRGTPQGPQNAKELFTQFLDFMERETVTNTLTNAPMENQEPVRIEHEITPVPQTDTKDELKELVN